MAKKIAIVSTKGGVCKTTLTANLGAALADLGQRVLIIDTDQQQTLSKFYHINYRAPCGLKELLKNASPVDCISSTNIENLDIVIHNDHKNKAISLWLSENPSIHIHYLASTLKSLDSVYDAILIDTVGVYNIGGLQEMAIRASDLCLSPVTPDWLSAKELPNTIDLLKKLELPEGVSFGPVIPPLAVLLCKTRHTSDSRTIVQHFSDTEGELFTEYYRSMNGKFSVLKTQIPETEPYKKASGRKIPIHRFESKRAGPTPSGAESMYSLATELFSHLVGFSFRNIKDE